MPVAVNHPHWGTCQLAVPVKPPPGPLRRCDFVFYGAPAGSAVAVEVLGALLPPPAAGLPQGLPAVGWGSDHLSLLVELRVVVPTPRASL